MAKSALPLHIDHQIPGRLRLWLYLAIECTGAVSESDQTESRLMPIPQILCSDFSMTWNDVLESLVSDFGLTPDTVYLLPLIPLIEVMWADGMTQPAEIAVFYDCLTKHLADLSNHADGEEVVSIEKAEKFANDLLHTRPDPEQLRRLSNLSVQLLNISHEEKLRRSVLDNCLDLAAIAVTRYPYERRDRIMSAEKQVLVALFQSLNLSEPQKKDAPSPATPLRMTR